MKIAIVNSSEIFKHPTNRLDAVYWGGKAAGKTAYKKSEQGLLIEDDINGSVMLKEEDAAEYNKAKAEIKRLQEKISTLTK